MDQDATVVFNGFLQLMAKEKMQVVEAVNEYFDSTNREPIRAEHEQRFRELDIVEKGIVCKCCGR